MSYTEVKLSGIVSIGHNSRIIKDSCFIGQIMNTTLLWLLLTFSEWTLLLTKFVEEGIPVVYCFS